MFSCYHVIKSERLSSFSVKTFGNSSMLHWQGNCFSEFMTIQQTSVVHVNICFHTTSYCITHTKHSYCTPYHIALHKQNIHIAHHTILHYIHKTFILHTIAYCIAHAKYSYCTPVYKTWLRLEVCHSCVRFLWTVLSINPRRILRGMWVPQTNSIADTNRTWHPELCTCRCTLRVHVGIQMQSVE